jgi:polyisoprenoid-binding protein YceI
MKITTLFALTLVALSLNALADGGNTAKKPAPATLNVDTQKSTLNWLAKKVTGEHNGTINITKGSLTVDGTKLTGGSFEIDMTSIKCLDLTDAGYNGKLVDHLKSDDFFNVTSFPKAVFKITKVTPIAGAKVGEPNFTIVGDLTIRDKTNPVTFPATVGIKGGNVTASAKSRRSLKVQREVPFKELLREPRRQDDLR